jgi:hypothetical protein
MTTPAPRGPIPNPGKPTARAYSAASHVTAGLSPMDWGDKCFLCSREIAEGAPQGFYRSRKGGFYRCHRGCLQTLEAQGGHPRDYHRFMAEKHAAPVHDVPTPMPPVAPAPVVPADLDPDELPPDPNTAAEATYNGPRSIKFNDFAHMQQFISSRGPIPKSVRVYVGETCMQAGGG